MAVPRQVSEPLRIKNDSAVGVLCVCSPISYGHIYSMNVRCLEVPPAPSIKLQMHMNAFHAGDLVI